MNGGTPRRERIGAFLVLAVSVAAAAAFAGSGWVQDDGTKILYDPRLHDWSGVVRGFVESYWPPPSKNGLYRPLAMSTLTLQWLLGGGELLLFRVVTLVLYALATFAVWRVASRLLPPWPATAAAILFAVHPVHTEVMAVAVNQGESVVVILTAVSFLLWADLVAGRRRGSAVAPLLVLAYVGALGFKEHALLIPAFLLLAELTDRTTPWRERLRARGALLAGLLLLGGAWWIWRAQVLGDFGGAVAAEGLRGDTIAERTTTMLGVVPEWLRLLTWPATLRSDYAPRQIDPELGWEVAQWLGLLCVAAWCLALAWGWRRDRTVAIGLLIVGLGLAPVSNILLPTGILLAERTLFLPSVGVVLIAGALLARGASWWQHAATGARGIALTLGAGLLLLAVARDVARAADWRDNGAFIKAQLRDAPLSWRAQMGYGIWAFENGDRRAGEAHLRQAIALWPHHARPYQTLADYYRGDALCGPALPLYAEALTRDPDRARQRLSAVACLLWVGRYHEAASVARDMTPTELDPERLVAAARTADSAAAVSAPPGTVRLAPGLGHAGEVGWRIR